MIDNSNTTPINLVCLIPFPSNSLMNMRTELNIASIMRLTYKDFWEGWAIHETNEFASEGKVYPVPLVNESRSVPPTLTAFPKKNKLNHYFYL